MFKFTCMCLLLKITIVYHTSTEVRHLTLWDSLPRTENVCKHALPVLTAPCKQNRYNHLCVTMRPHTSTWWNGLQKTTAPKQQTGDWTSTHESQPDVEPNSCTSFHGSLLAHLFTTAWPLYRGLSVCWHLGPCGYFPPMSSGAERKQGWPLIVS